MNSRSPIETDPPRLKDRIRQATVEAILEAAEQVLSEGLHTARMNDIAQRAGVAVGTLYNHFADRDAIVNALMAERKRQLLERVDQVLDAEGLPFAERLRLVFEVTSNFFVQHMPFYGVYAQCETIKGGLKTLPDVYARMEKLVKRGVREKALRADSEEIFPALLMGTVRAIFVRLQVLGDKAGQIDPAELTRFFLDGAGA
jgi:AcrR family transcriptional regulator